jgi:hypothetical protein
MLSLPPVTPVLYFDTDNLVVARDLDTLICSILHLKYQIKQAIPTYTQPLKYLVLPF